MTNSQTKESKVMSKRVTLNIREIEYIVSALKDLQNPGLVDYEVVKTGRRVYQDIIDKLTGLDKGE
jgi:hypothetical protein